MNDMINHPPHYAGRYRHEVIEMTSGLINEQAQAFKYILRCRFKGDELGDMRKALWYVTYALNEFIRIPPLNSRKRQLRREFEDDLRGQGESDLASIVHELGVPDFRSAAVLIAARIAQKEGRITPPELDEEML